MNFNNAVDFDGLTLGGIDEEWIQLHKWIIEIWDIHKLSISSFLESSGLDSNNNFFRQKVSKIGNETRPSTRNGTTGKSLRQSISNLRSREIFNIVRSVRDSHFDYAIADWRMDHLQYLHKNSIRNLSVSADKENTQKLILNVHELESNVLPEATLLDTIWNDTTISANFSRELASTRSIKCQLLNSVLSSVAGITVGSTSATETIIYFNGICMLFTAAHLITPRMATTIKKNAYNILYQKYETDSIDTNFAKTVIPLIDVDMDVALGIPAVNIFVANCSKGCERPILFKKWWPEVLIDRFERLKKMTLIKEGASSGITTGCITDFCSSDYFHVRGHQMTPFAIPGDSGALVLDLETGLVVGVVSMIELVKDSGFVTIVKPIWEFYDFVSEDAVDIIYHVAKSQSGSNFNDDQGEGHRNLPPSVPKTVTAVLGAQNG